MAYINNEQTIQKRNRQTQINEKHYRKQKKDNKTCLARGKIWLSLVNLRGKKKTKET